MLRSARVAVLSTLLTLVAGTARAEGAAEPPPALDLVQRFGTLVEGHVTAIDDVKRTFELTTTDGRRETIAWQYAIGAAGPSFVSAPTDGPERVPFRVVGSEHQVELFVAWKEGLVLHEVHCPSLPCTVPVVRGRVALEGAHPDFADTVVVPPGSGGETVAITTHPVRLGTAQVLAGVGLAMVCFGIAVLSGASDNNRGADIAGVSVGSGVLVGLAGLPFYLASGPHAALVAPPSPRTAWSFEVSPAGGLRVRF